MNRKKRENIESEGISISDDIWTLNEQEISKLFKKKEDIPPAEPGMVQRVIKEEPLEPPKDPFSLTEEEKDEYREDLKREINAKFGRKKLPVLESPGRTIELKDLPCVIGKKGDYRIDDEYISRRHCSITEDDGEYYIEDLGSMNGTYVDGRELAKGERALLSDGCVVTLADREFDFRLR